MRTAILGPRGTFSEEAALHFDESSELVLCPDIEEIFKQVISGDANYGIVPVENSLEGPIGMTSELLLKEDVKVFSEIVLDIRQSLMALDGTVITDIDTVISHPHALAQCKNTLSAMNARTRNFPSTADAAREIAEKDLKQTAAIAPRAAANLYGLKILREDVQDEGTNQTRFFAIAKEDHKRTGNDKTSLIIGLKDRPGALYDTLKSFAEHGINLTKIESRPSRKALGDYLFYMDTEGHREDEKLSKVLKELNDTTAFLKVLGSYPMA